MDNNNELKELILGMREAFSHGKNAMEYARKLKSSEKNSVLATLIAYDLQAGSYIVGARELPVYRKLWCTQIADVIKRYTTNFRSILEVGCGEATTLSGVIQELNSNNLKALGFDISWSRINLGNKWLNEWHISANLFVADLFNIPLADNAIDVVYTSHSLEPNGGRELEAISELLRVARRTVVLVEPIYELAGDDAKKRMKNHGYVKNLKKTAEYLGVKVLEYKLLEHIANPLNPSGVIVIEKSVQNNGKLGNTKINYQDPISGMRLIKLRDVYYSKKAGIAYPIIRNIPVLIAANAVVASNLDNC